MSARRNSHYHEYPIFLHAINRELHDAIGRQVDRGLILQSIRMFSVLSGQTMFCNVSQIHELFFDHPEALKEITDLSNAGRFIAHSDYGSFDEFRESRVEYFEHSISKHPGFFLAPSPQLRRLPHGFLGTGFSATKDIERRLRLWLEDDPLSTLRRSLTHNDQESLQENESWLLQTLDGRDQKALTFDAFERTADGVFSRSSEGAIRRSLTEAYIEGYVDAFSARCIWAYPGISHFEKFDLYAGLHMELAVAVMNETGIHDHLRRSKGYGLVKRLTSEQSHEIAYLREGYSILAESIDSLFDKKDPWHVCNAAVRSRIQHLKYSGALRPTSSTSGYFDLLLRAGEALHRTGTPSHGTPSHRPRLVGDLALPSRSMPETAVPDAALANEAYDTSTKPQLRWWETHALVVVAGGLLIGLAVFLGLWLFFDTPIGQVFLLSVLATLIGGGLIFYFHPDNWYRRMALVGIVLTGFGGVSYNLTYAGGTGLSVGSVQIGSFPSDILVLGGLVITVVSIGADAYFRGKRSS